MTAQTFDIPDWETLSLLRETRVGRICIIDQGYPIAIPVNFIVADHPNGFNIVFRTSPNTMLGRYEGLASLEVDRIDIENSHAWSVFVRGTLRRVLGTHELPDPGPLLDVGRHQWLILEPSAMSGRRFIIEPSPDGFFVEWQQVPG